MVKSIVWGAPAAVIAVAAFTVLALDRHVSVISQAHAEDLKAADSEPPCPRRDATLRGTYMSMGGGTVVGVGPVAFVGTVYFDGKGGVTNPFTISAAGVVSRLVARATYSVKSDCTATFTTTDDTQHFDMRVSPDGSKVEYIETDAGTVISGSAARVKD